MNLFIEACHRRLPPSALTNVIVADPRWFMLAISRRVCGTRFTRFLADIQFKPLHGLAGTSATLYANPMFGFQCEKIIATDDAVPPGAGTIIRSAKVGIFPQITDSPTRFFLINALGNGFNWDTCERGNTITLIIDFKTDCTFNITLRGKGTL